MYSVNSFDLDERVEDTDGFIQAIAQYSKDSITLHNKQQLRNCAVLGITMPNSYATRFDQDCNDEYKPNLKDTEKQKQKNDS